MTTTINASTSAGLVQTADTSGVLALQTAGTTAVTIDASQNVGIGTTAPVDKLSILSGYYSLGAYRNSDVSVVGAAGMSISAGALVGTTPTAAVGFNAVLQDANTGYMSLATRASGTVAEKMRIDSTGNVTKPKSASFLVKVANNVSNVTGDGTAYTVLYDTVISDYNSNYATATGKFTAPVAGIYQFNVLSYLYVLIGGTTNVTIELVTTARTYQMTVGSWLSGYAQFPAGSTLANMSAADTAFVRITVSGTTKTISIGQASSFFSGFLVG